MNEANFVEVGGADREKDDINYITTEINEDVSVKVGGADSEKDDNSKPITTEMNENVSVKVDSKKDDINYKPPHNGKPISKIGISPEEKYLVTYSPDDKSIFGWSIDKGELNPDNYRYKAFIVANPVVIYRNINKIYVSDDKKLAYIYKRINRYHLEIIDMNNNNKIKLDLDHDEIEVSYKYCTFNLKREFILCGKVLNDNYRYMNIIFIYSTQTWTCKRMYEIPKEFKFISVSKYSKLYLLSSNNHIYEWNLLTEKSAKMFSCDEPGLIRISSNEKFVCLKIKDKIIIYSIELEIPIITLQTGAVEIQEKTKEQTNVRTSGFISLSDILRPFLNNGIYDSIMTYYQEDCKTESLSKIVQDTKSTEYIIGTLNGFILDGDILNIKFKVLVDKLERLNVHSFSLYADDINDENLQKTYSFNNDKWEINRSTEEIEIKFLKNNESRRIKRFNRYLAMRYMIFKNNDILLVLNDYENLNQDLVRVFIFHFNENNNKTSLNYFHSEDKEFSISPLPLQNDKNFKQCNEWILNNKESLLKYGVELFSFAIRERNFKLIDEIYKKCIFYFNEDLQNNKTFLGIISITMPLLNEYYPEFILKYSLETNMITDSQFYNIENNLHLYSKNLQLIDLTRSILWSKYNLKTELYNDIFWYHFINYIKISNTLPGLYVKLYFYVTKKVSKYIHTSTITSTINFMIPYIKFVNYPKDYNWWELIKPQPSPFVKTVNENIYKTWNGEALINFKWNTYGKYYYAVIWISFMVLLSCFTIAATVPQQYIDKNIQNQLFIVSIIFGFIHLSFEIRQFIYSPKKWIRDFWNIFDLISYLLPIITSFKWLQTNDMNDHHIIQLLSFSCLFLDIKFLLFFRAFESFGIYFEIIINVAKQIIYFLVLLFIIIISFAHAFYILLLPRSDYSFDQYTSNNDPNNPWNIALTFNQVFNDGTMNSFFIQKPDENTNMFIDFRTSLLAMYNFLTGDSSALSNWPFLNNQSLVILIVLFSLLVVVYLMNLFIGLLNMAINKDDDRVSYLKQKAEILAEIELFYLLPNQRRWNSWFPEVIYYYANVDKAREEIKRLIKNGEWTDSFPEMRKNLFEKLDIPDNVEKIDKIDADLQKVLKILNSAGLTNNLLSRDSTT
ncbi:hypothetical protein RirG_191230 [Rhizophagus irregularis DAOM 197198w]|uniref:Ion transport domain-containing protein n=3 Tax=Rhizophagus irregularis TaxID=588596 RepID=A0A015KHU4_RHIIW|nr:hypothetical protein RirG_191230 [Rhizophagus irregularis DAOM 197198w]